MLDQAKYNWERNSAEAKSSIVLPLPDIHFLFLVIFFIAPDNWTQTVSFNQLRKQKVFPFTLLWEVYHHTGEEFIEVRMSW